MMKSIPKGNLDGIVSDMLSAIGLQWRGTFNLMMDKIDDSVFSTIQHNNELTNTNIKYNTQDRVKISEIQLTCWQVIFTHRWDMKLILI